MLKMEKVCVYATFKRRNKFLAVVGPVTHNPLCLSVSQPATVGSQRASWTARWSGRTSATATPSSTSVCQASGWLARPCESASRTTSGPDNFLSAYVSKKEQKTQFLLVGEKYLFQPSTTQFIYCFLIPVAALLSARTHRRTVSAGWIVLCWRR